MTYIHPDTCPECNGTGRTDNHITGEVECSACEGTGGNNPEPMSKHTKLDELLTAIKDAESHLGWVREQVLAIDPDDHESGDPAVNLADARSELSNASNSIDDAMGLIDELLAPDPGPDDDPRLP